MVALEQRSTSGPIVGSSDRRPISWWVDQCGSCQVPGSAPPRSFWGSLSGQDRPWNMVERGCNPVPGLFQCPQPRLRYTYVALEHRWRSLPPGPLGRPDCSQTAAGEWGGSTDHEIAISGSPGCRQDCVLPGTCAGRTAR